MTSGAHSAEPAEVRALEARVAALEAVVMVCSCQYQEHTPLWYESVRTCPLHRRFYNSSLAPEWANR